MTHKDLGFTFTGIDIEINHECNRTCTYCPNSKTERKTQGHMSEELFVSIMKQLREIHYAGRISYHFYNEPLLSPNLDRFVMLTREYLPKSFIDIYTNGTLLTEERLRTLAHNGVNKFTVTKHHGKDPYPFEDLLPTLEPELQAKVKFQNFRDLLLTSRGGLLKVGYIKDKPPLPIPCFIPMSIFIITVNGGIVPCFEDYHEQNVMGNLQEQKLTDIWNSEKYRNFRDDLKNNKREDHPVCKTCNCQLMFM